MSKLISSLALIYLGYYLGSRKLVTDAHLQSLVDTNKEVLTSLEQQGII